VPPDLCPKNVNLKVRADGAHNVFVDGRMEGFVLADGREPALSLELTGGPELVGAQISLADDQGAFLEATAELPATVTAFPPDARFYDGHLDLEVWLRAFPVPVRVLDDQPGVSTERTVLMDGSLRLRGSDRLHGSTQIVMTFPEWPKLAAHRLVLEATTGSDSTDASGDLTGSVTFARARDAILEADVRYPAILTRAPPFFTTRADEDLSVRLNTETIALDELDLFLPVGVHLGGTGQIEFSATGPVDDPNLSGRFHTTGAEISYAGIAQVFASGDIRLEGTKSRPSPIGKIRIPRGTILLPDLPEELHPTEGDALLLAARPADPDEGEATADTSSAETPSWVTGSDIDIDVEIPAAFWIRGHGLNVELAGNLHIRPAETQLTLVGELRALRGDLQLLGRTLKLDRGTVSFAGGDEINPTMDVALSTDVEGTKIHIILGGTVQDPQLTLSSEPQMRESDIMSVLLFGKPYNDLDDTQADQVQNRTTELVASVGAAKLQEQLSGDLGVDVVSVQSSAMDSKSSTVAFGKYLTDRVLLSYARPLDDRSTPYVSVEYLLKGRFKLDSVFGSDNNNAFGLGWSRDY
jgi:hypothetical protein